MSSTQRGCPKSTALRRQAISGNDVRRSRNRGLTLGVVSRSRIWRDMMGVLATDNQING